MFFFNSRSDTLTVVLRPTRKVVVGTQVIVEEGIKARFEQGIFTTESEEVAQLLRDKIKKTNDRDIVEIGNEEETAFERAKKLLNQRAPSSAASMSKTLNPSIVEREPAEKIVCPICDPAREFKTQRDLNLHLMGHRPGMTPPPAVKMAEAPAETPPADFLEDA